MRKSLQISAINSLQKTHLTTAQIKIYPLQAKIIKQFMAIELKCMTHRTKPKEIKKKMYFVPLLYFTSREAGWPCG